MICKPFVTVCSLMVLYHMFHKVRTITLEISGLLFLNQVQVIKVIQVIKVMSTNDPTLKIFALGHGISKPGLHDYMPMRFHVGFRQPVLPLSIHHHSLHGPGPHRGPHRESRRVPRRVWRPCWYSNELSQTRRAGARAVGQELSISRLTRWGDGSKRPARGARNTYEEVTLHSWSAVPILYDCLCLYMCLSSVIP